MSATEELANRVIRDAIATNLWITLDRLEGKDVVAEFYVTLDEYTAVAAYLQYDSELSKLSGLRLRVRMPNGVIYDPPVKPRYEEVTDRTVAKLGEFKVHEVTEVCPSEFVAWFAAIIAILALVVSVMK